MSAEVRPMRRSDLDQVMAIERDAFMAPWSEGMFLQELQAEGRDWLVIDSPAGVLAYGGMLVVGAEAHLMDLAVRSDVRRLGLGSALLSMLADRAAESGARFVYLEVRPSNTAARETYGRAGFAQVGTRPKYYAETGEDAIIMVTPDLSGRAREALARRAAESRDRLAAMTVPGHGPGTDARTEEGDQIVLAIETSCDETAAAVTRGPRKLLSSVIASQVEFHARFGGVVPEIASRKHTEAVVAVVDAALEEAGVTLEDLSAVAVTQGPGLIGALVVGVAFAKGLALATGLPLVGVNHLEAHIFANVLADPEVAPPLVALVVSGGHTSLVHMPEWGVYHTLGETLDDAAGEAFDKVAKLLGMGYPGGPAISRLAEKGDPAAIDFPRPMIRSGDHDFSLSGLKTAVINHVRHEQAAGRRIDLADLAASFQQAVIDVQVAKSVSAVREYRPKRFCLAGGVAANAALRQALRDAMAAEGVTVCVPPMGLCTDNAAMVAAAGHFRLLQGDVLPTGAEAIANLRLD